MRTWLKNTRGFLALLLGMGLLRTAVADWNPVPSGSMRPTILEGDVVLELRIEADGSVGKARVLSATPPGLFDDAASHADIIHRHHQQACSGDVHGLQQVAAA